MSKLSKLLCFSSKSRGKSWCICLENLYQRYPCYTFSLVSVRRNQLATYWTVPDSICTNCGICPTLFSSWIRYNYEFIAPHRRMHRQVYITENHSSISTQKNQPEMWSAAPPYGRVLGTNYSTEVDNTLAMSWIRVSDNAVVGEEKKGQTFPDHIRAQYEDLWEPSTPNLPLTSVSTRIKNIVKDCVFSGCHASVLRA